MFLHKKLKTQRNQLNHVGSPPHNLNTTTSIETATERTVPAVATPLLSELDQRLTNLAVPNFCLIAKNSFRGPREK